MSSRTRAIDFETITECSIEFCAGGLLAGVALITVIDIPRVDKWMDLSLIRVRVSQHEFDGVPSESASLVQPETPSEPLERSLCHQQLFCVFVCSGSSGWWRSVGVWPSGRCIFELHPLASSCFGSPVGDRPVKEDRRGSSIIA
jgi:hypothetical protein